VYFRPMIGNTVDDCRLVEGVVVTGENVGHFLYLTALNCVVILEKIEPGD